MSVVLGNQFIVKLNQGLCRLYISLYQQGSTNQTLIQVMYKKNGKVGRCKFILNINFEGFFYFLIAVEIRKKKKKKRRRRRRMKLRQKKEKRWLKEDPRVLDVECVCESKQRERILRLNDERQDSSSWIIPVLSLLSLSIHPSCLSACLTPAGLCARVLSFFSSPRTSHLPRDDVYNVTLCSVLLL